MSASSQLFENKEYITDIQVDTALQVVVEVDVTAQRFPVSIECTTDQFSVFIQYRTSGVTAGDVIG